MKTNSYLRCEIAEWDDIRIDLNVTMRLYLRTRGSTLNLRMNQYTVMLIQMFDVNLDDKTTSNKKSPANGYGQARLLVVFGKFSAL